MADADDLERRFLLVKRGLYYAPDNHGYTGIKERAGRYLESDASPDSGVTAIHEDEAPDYSPACFHDTAREHLQSKVDRLRAENEALREALGQIVQWADAYPREVFEEPDLKAVKTLLTDAGMRVQMDRMHAAWARHLTEGFGRIARQALQEGSRHE